MQSDEKSGSSSREAVTRLDLTETLTAGHFLGMQASQTAKRSGYRVKSSARVTLRNKLTVKRKETTRSKSTRRKKKRAIEMTTRHTAIAVASVAMEICLIESLAL